MKRVVIIIFLLFIADGVLFAQRQVWLDAMQNAKSDTAKVMLLLQLPLYYPFYYPQTVDSGLYFQQKAAALAEKINWKKGMAIAYESIADRYMGVGWDSKINYSQRLAYCFKALKVYEDQKDKKNQAVMLLKISSVYGALENYSKGIEYASKSLRLNNETKPDFMELMHLKPAKTGGITVFTAPKNGGMYNIETFYSKLGNYPQALGYLFKELENAERLRDTNQIGKMYSEIRNNYREQKNFDKALEYDIKLSKMKDPYSLSYNATGTIFIDNSKYYKDIGDDYCSLSNYNNAIEYYNKALKVDKSNDSAEFAKNGIKNIEYFINQAYLEDDYHNLSKVFIKLHNYNSALIYASKSYEMALKQKDITQTLADYSTQIGKIYLAIAKDSNNIKTDSLIPAGKTANLLKAREYLIWNSSIEKYPALIETQKLLGDSKGALESLEAYRALLDSEAAERDIKQIGDVEIKQAADEAETQSLLETQQQQAMLLNQQKLTLAEQDKDLQYLNLQKTEADLQVEQSKRAENQKQLTVSQKEQALQNAELNLKNKTIQNQALQRNVFIGCGAMLLVLSLFVYRNFRTERQSNKIITKEKKRSDDLLLNILPAEVAEELKEKGSAAAKYFDDVTVLFTDFVGFTKAGERMTPQQLVDELDACFKEFDVITGKYGIEKIKTIGDAYLAVSGLPIPTTSHAENIVNAAVEIRNFMVRRRQQMGDKTFEVRIGVHSGSVVAGIVGIKKFAYDIWGDTVNTAARMEQNSEGGKVNISQATYELLKDKFACAYRGEIDAKNKGAMKMYFVEKEAG